MSRRRRKARKPQPIPATLPDLEATPEKRLPEPTYPKRRPGRPTLLTPETEGRFLGMLLKGTYRSVAARACGLSPITVERWVKRGRGKDPLRPPLPEYVRFVRLVEQAEAMAEAMVTDNVVHRSKYDHNAGLAWLRTRYPERWPRFPGEVEETPERPFPPPNPQPDMAASPQIAQQTNILVLNSDEWPELATRLIASRRSRQEEQAVAEAQMVVTEEAATDGVPRHARLGALRADSAE